MRRRLLLAASLAAAASLTSCASGAGTAFGYGSGDGTGSLFAAPVAQGRGAVIGVPLDERAGEPVQVISLAPLRSDNIVVGRSSVAPVLQERDGSRLSFGVNQPSSDPVLLREWRMREPAEGFRIRAGATDLQGLLQVSVRNPARPARVVGVTIAYRQGGRTVTETTGVTACFFPEHRASACALP